MKVLVVGGTGLIGGRAALHLSELGHTVTIGSRRPPPPESPLASLNATTLDFLKPEQCVDALAAADAVVFAGGNDFRHIPKGIPEEQYWQRANVQGVPNFLKAAKEARVRRAVYVGTYYPQTMPHLVQTVPYVRSRHEAEVGALALNGSGFEICSVNPPSVIGVVPGLIDTRLRARAHYALGQMPEIPDFAIGGGTNVMSSQSLAEAIAGALLGGEPGKAYLVGDENLLFKQYLELFFRAAGRPMDLPVIDQEHPLFPDAAIYFGRGNTLFYEPDPSEQKILEYRRNDIARTAEEIVNYYRDL